MKRRNQEINIFSMSALDLFASALGAFILITLILFPFFPNTGDSPERVASVRAEIADEMAALQQALAQAQTQLTQASSDSQSLQQQLGSCTSDLDSLQGQVQACRAELAQTFVLVVISWSSSDDVDLHVIDPAGNEYYYEDDRFPGSDAALEEDNTQGPGNEIWLSPQAMPGDYEVYINMYDKSDDSPASIRGSILHQNGQEQLTSITINNQDEKPLFVRFNVSAEGNVSLR
ncbi:MAG: hypothetical protein COC19_06495 [SAR86 cluster bacterium]|uniref:DUF2135 domain-containing protein n=1 Tax=SAR86 cluster bacterium TaxID=2030880 RepID=A0A2A4MJN4_9GAMM|nr:MAG: hypothetical protein COC19_06495 [SAR86 cluster bacterium]